MIENNILLKIAGGLALLGSASGTMLANVEAKDDGSVAGNAGEPTCRQAADRPLLVPAGEVLYGEDGPSSPGAVRHVERFWIDRTEVTNRQFAAFVKATGYVTEAEKANAGAVFRLPLTLPRGLDDPSQWWALIEGADWRHPTGPASEIAERGHYPVTQVTYEDARHYAAWRGGRLPSQVEWERAVRGAQDAPRSPVGWAYDGEGRPIANTWQGVFPVRNTGDDGHAELAPVGCYRPNDLGLYDMVGNVWEWTASEFAGDERQIVKGGSYLCAMNYCANFRPAAWQAQEKDLPTSHIGFRVVYDRPPSRDTGRE